MHFAYIDIAKQSILAASFVAAISDYLILNFSKKKQNQQKPD